MSDTKLDATGLKCPLPVLKAKKAIRSLPVGSAIEVLATDPGAVDDFQAFCETSGNTLVEQDEQGGVYRFVIRKAG